MVSWCEEDCIKILKHLHDAASEDTKLIVVDIIVNHACHDIPDVTDAVEGAYTEPMPHPLPANGGRATEVDLLLDIHVSTPTLVTSPILTSTTTL